MSMNPQLAAIYGTGGFQQPQAQAPAMTQEDLEILAQAEMLSKVAAANGYDIDQMTNEQIVELARHLNFVQTDEEKVAQARIEEADTQGRIMAHAYVDELRKLGAAPQAMVAPAATQADPQAGQVEVLEAMAQDRAQNYLNALGVEGVEPVAEAKVASPIIEKYVDDRAIEILSEKGVL